MDECRDSNRWKVAFGKGIIFGRPGYLRSGPCSSVNTSLTLRSPEIMQHRGSSRALHNGAFPSAQNMSLLRQRRCETSFGHEGGKMRLSGGVRASMHACQTERVRQTFDRQGSAFKIRILRSDFARQSLHSYARPRRVKSDMFHSPNTLVLSSPGKFLEHDSFLRGWRAGPVILDYRSFISKLRRLSLHWLLSLQPVS